jgi:UDP-N-acetylmuramate dehydrogenase
MFKDLLDQLKLCGKLEYNYNLKHLTRFKVGGGCDVFYKPHNAEELSYFLQNIPLNIPVTTIGAGSNILIRDGGIDGIVIKLSKNFNKLQYQGDYIVAGANTLNYSVVQFALLHEVRNLEFLIGIPGSVGGGIFMNAGAYGTEFKDIIIDFKAIDRNGIFHEIKAETMQCEYRKSNLPEDWIILEAKLKAVKGDASIIKARVEEISLERHRTQPYSAQTAGSTFMNPTGHKAWELIDSVGLRDFKINDASFSTKHCNFLINNGNASAKDLEDLGDLAVKKVRDSKGIELIWEVKKIGRH